jgi:hypothetical protein
VAAAIAFNAGAFQHSSLTGWGHSNQIDKRYLEPEARNNLKAQDLAGNRGESATEAASDNATGAGGAPNANLLGPDAAAAAQFARRAYPAKTIPANAAQVAQQTFATYGENKEFTGPSNQNTPFLWDLIGPTHATQPGILSFSGALFHMAGRVTSMAISPNCSSNSNCRLWVAAAGGGIWRTDNPFSPDPYWVYVSKGFSSNAIGTIDRDPTDPTGNTLYAGTGEPNAAGDNESGVGIYKTTNGGDTWTLLPGSTMFATRSISKVVVDPANPSHLYVGVARGVRGISSVTGGTFSRTGPCLELSNGLACQDGPDQAPLGLYESTDGGTTFTLAWDAEGSLRGVNDVGLDPSDPTTVYAAAFQKGIWRRSVTEDGSATFKQVFGGTSPAQNTDRTQFELTTVPAGTPGVAAGTRIYVIDGAVGITFAKVNDVDVQTGFPSQVWRADGANALTAAALLATEGEPNAQNPGPNTGPGWARKSARTSRPASNPYRPAYNPCTGQCWYDEDVYSPNGHPEIVYVLGSYQYTELHERSNGRGVLLSTTAGDPDPAIKGGNFSDLTWDDTPGAQPDQIHPDQHAIVTPDSNPFLFFEGSDGGMTRSDGQFDDASGDCAKYHVNDADTLVHCQRVLSRVPHQLYDTLNKGLSTLQFQSLSINPDRPKESVQGGTQDNGTFEWTGAPTQWSEEIYGDGGQSGFNYCDTKIRFNTFFGYYTDENFFGGQPDKWVVTSGPLSSLNNGESQAFYIPEVTDYTNCGPKASFPQFTTAAATAANSNQYNGGVSDGSPSGTYPPTPAAGRQIGDALGFQYAGEQHVWRTIDNGGPQPYLESCPEFTTSGDDPRCGDWQPLGDPAYTGPGHKTAGEPGDLTSTWYGADRQAGNVVATERNPGNANDLWAATGSGRVFITHNVNAVDPKSVEFCRLDSLALAAGVGAVPPPRFISSIYPDPTNPNRAYLSYDGYSANTKDAPGHVFEVTVTPAASPTACPSAAVWRDLLVEQGAPGHSDPAADIPITDLVKDDLTGDLYAATDFGVLRGKAGGTPLGATYTWTDSGANLPKVEVPGITIDPCTRLLYAATHGRSAWRMFLPAVKNAPQKGCPRTP